AVGVNLLEARRVNELAGNRDAFVAIDPRENVDAQCDDCARKPVRNARDEGQDRDCDGQSHGPRGLTASLWTCFMAESAQARGPRRRSLGNRTKSVREPAPNATFRALAKLLPC